MADGPKSLMLINHTLGPSPFHVILCCAKNRQLLSNVFPNFLFPDTPQHPTSSRSTTWWVVGDSIIKRASRVWSNLNTFQEGITIQWIGVGGLKTKNLFNVVAQKLTNNPQPKVLIIAVGTNDIYDNSQLSLKNQLCQLYSQLKTLLPGTKIMYSDILPRLKWHKFSSPQDDKCCEKRRKFVNHSMSSILGPANVFRHPQFNPSSSEIYELIKGKGDWVHLTYPHGFSTFFHSFITYIYRL